MSESLKDKKRLTSKQQRFVAAYSSGMSGQEAVIEAGYNVSSTESAKSLATTMLSNDKIQNALAEAIHRQFPNVPDLAASTLVDILINPEQRASDKLKAIELLAKVCGWQAPSKHANLNVTLREKFKLPEE
jgi:phage terminase small subunit